jgi:hypothetical protein
MVVAASIDGGTVVGSPVLHQGWEAVRLSRN